MLPKQLYELFVGFEERAADIYLDLSVRFVKNIDFSWFWVEMAMEEKQHAGMLQYCCETGMLSVNLPDSDQIIRLAALFKRLSEKVMSPNLTIDDAFDVAVELETSEINDIYSKLTANVDGPWYIVRKKIELATENHFEKLKAAAREFQASKEIQLKLETLAAQHA